MKIETLNLRKRKYFLYVLVVGVVLLLILNLTTSKAKYQTTQSIKIVEGTIKNYSPGDFNILAVKIQNDSGEYESSDTVPESGYVLNKTESYCTIPDGNGGSTTDTSIPMEYKDGKVYIGVNTKGTKCYLYFAQLCGGACKTVLANMPTVTTRNDFSSVLTTSSTGTIYTAEDDYGTSYYFAGAPTDNWVKFAGFYWRIIRINGDGTIRMIYQGTAANTTGTGTQITTNKFSVAYNNNMYAGYMYTNGEVHGSGTNSAIKEVLDTWYNNNLMEYEHYIATGNGAIFCNDRQPSTSRSSLNGSGGTGTVETYYAAYIRLNANKVPTLKCADSRDRFSTNIGLITADEVSYAGGVNGTSNSNYYLYTGQRYWNISPSYFSVQYTVVDMSTIDQNGALRFDGVFAGSFAVRPVINLKADIVFVNGGTGTASNPYVVQS